MSTSIPVKVAEFSTSGSNASTTGAVALTSAVPAGSVLILAAMAAGAGRTFTPTDSAGLTWVPVVGTWPSVTTATAGTIAAWTAEVTTSLTTSDTVSVTANANTVLAMAAFAVTGVDLADPLLDTSSGANSDISSTLTLPEVATAPGALVVAIGGLAAVLASPVVSSTPATLVHEVVATGAASNRLFHVAAEVAGSTGTVEPQFTTSIALRQAGIALTLNAASTPTPDPGDVVWMWTGAPTATSAVVHARTEDATSCRLAVSTSPEMTSPTFVAEQTPDTYGIVRFQATGLIANTRYYFQVTDIPPGEDEVLIGTVGTLRTLGAAGTPVATRKVTIGGCLQTNATETSALANAQAWAPDWGHFNGDFFYNGNTVATEANWVGLYNSQISGTGSVLKDFLASGLGAYELVSDHDTTPVDNGDSNTAWASHELAGWRKVVPHLDGSGDSTCRDQQWDDGRVSFFMVDTRSVNRSSGTSADNSSKTMLGAAQKARLLHWLANNPAPFKVIVSDPPWMGAADTVAKPDAWWSYANERGQVIDAIAAQDSHVEVWHGDSHLVGYATAAKNTWGNFPVICAAPWWQSGGGRNQSTYSQFFNNGGEWAAVYGRVTFTDDGTTITRTFQGVDALADEVRFTDLVTVNTSAPEPNVTHFYISDGTLHPLTVGYVVQ